MSASNMSGDAAMNTKDQSLSVSGTAANNMAASMKIGQQAPMMGSSNNAYLDSVSMKNIELKNYESFNQAKL